MSKSKKIAMTSAVAMVTAGVTTASNLTFTTKASANSKKGHFGHTKKPGYKPKVT